MTPASTILITGATGQVGGALARLFPQALTPARAELDLADPASIRACVRRVRPQWILNPAAYTAVDKAESESALAYAINARAPGILGEEARTLDARVVHFSTDYVFDGAKATAYAESDPTNPLGVYGASKLAGEQALAASGAASIILRTSWVYAATGKNFLLTVLRLARERARSGQPLKIVADQRGAPTSACDLAALTAHIVRGATLEGAGDVYHATSSGQTSWHGFAVEALRQASIFEPATHFAEPQPIPTSEYPTPAHRPANSTLDCRRLAARFGFTLPRWQDALSSVIAEHYRS